MFVWGGASFPREIKEFRVGLFFKKKKVGRDGIDPHFS
jgi:hypothetical protein